MLTHALLTTNNGKGDHDEKRIKKSTGDRTCGNTWISCFGCGNNSKCRNGNNSRNNITNNNSREGFPQKCDW